MIGVDSMNNLTDMYLTLERLDNIRRNLMILVVDGFDEYNGFSKECLECLKHNRDELTEIINEIEFKDV